MNSIDYEQLWAEERLRRASIEAAMDNLVAMQERRIADLQAKVKRNDELLILAVRYFYGGHDIDDSSPCPACDHWQEDFPKMVAAVRERERSTTR